MAVRQGEKEIFIAQQLGADSEQTLVNLISDACRQYGKRIAFSNMGGHLSYAELDSAARDFAAYLQHYSGLEPGDRLAIQLPNILQYPIVLFGALRAGLVVVNTNPLYTATELRRQFVDSGAKGLVVLANMADKVEEIIDQTAIETVIVTELGDALPSWRRWLVNGNVRYLKRMVPRYQLPGAISYRSALERGKAQTFTPVQLDSDDLALLQYTGGTTGIAKGAMLSHRNLVANLLQVGEILESVRGDEPDLMVAPLPLYHIYSLTVSCLLMLSIGGQVLLITKPRNISGFVRQLRGSKFTLFCGLNTLFQALERHPDFHQLNFDHLKLTVSGGMGLLPEVAERWSQATGKPIIEGYGLTEAAPIVCANPPQAIKPGTIGVPMPGTELRLVDEEGQPVPVGGAGELCVKGPQVMRGYWQRPDETERVFDDQGWLRTGDIAQVDHQGYWKIIDRKKDVINVGGFNVYPNEIEEVLLAHPDVENCVAVGVKQEAGDEKVKLYLVSSNPALRVEQIRTYCRERLTAYKVPSLVEFRSELPQSPIGKVLRRALREQANNTPLGSLGGGSLGGKIEAPLGHFE